MRDQKQIIIDIDNDGNCSIDGQGFQGTECAHFLNEIEEAIGTKVSETDKPEYDQRQQARGRNTQRESR